MRWTRDRGIDDYNQRHAFTRVGMTFGGEVDADEGWEHAEDADMTKSNGTDNYQGAISSPDATQPYEKRSTIILQSLASSSP